MSVENAVALTWGMPEGARAASAHGNLRHTAAKHSDHMSESALACSDVMRIRFMAHWLKGKENKETVAVVL